MRRADDLVRVCAEPAGTRAVIIEEDGVVAYAYLRDGDALVGDVWLYNVGADPASVDWHDPALMPFCNPAAYCGDAPLPRLRDDAVVKCRWSAQGVLVVVDGVPWALLERDARPGWSRNARVAGPLARPLREMLTP